VAVEFAQSIADRTRAVAYVLKGYRPNKRRFRSPAYYVSRSKAPEIVVDGLPSPELVGPPYSGALLLDTFYPRDPSISGPRGSTDISGET
jgi:hypothetical protein